ncbi:hypothetical protein [Salibacterium salarium]|uniref:hypothetical protein n=1 Tax=Salibacterium salarium TaxID=284579 RepID=UPI000F798E30|nr:hypothetical protein [Salibacterium salarium]
MTRGNQREEIFHVWSQQLGGQALFVFNKPLVSIIFEHLTVLNVVASLSIPALYVGAAVVIKTFYAVGGIMRRRVY